MKKYRFRKMYFLCEDKRVISPNVRMATAFQYREDAEAVLRERLIRENGGTLAYMQNKPLPSLSVEEFYFVPAQVFKEVLSSFADE